MQDKIKNKEIEAKRRRAKRYITIGEIILLICIGYFLYKESQIQDLNNQNTKITNDYNKLKEKHTELENDYDKLNSNYASLNNNYTKLQKAHKKLQNLPDVTVYADVDGEDVELTFYSTIEEAKDNVKEIDNGAYICALNTANERKNLLTLLIDGKKMYTFRPVETKK